MVKIFRKLDKPLLITTLIMFIVGLVMICSASYVTAINTLDNAYYYLIRQGKILVICLIGFLILITFPLKVYKKFYKEIIILSILLLLYVYFFGTVSNGTKGWIPLYIFNFQPSEFSKIAIIIFFAVYYYKHRDNKDSYAVALKPFIFVFIIFGLIVVQPDLGSAIINVILAALIFFGVPLLPEVKKKTKRIVFITFVFGIALIGGLLLTGKSGLYEYQLQRFNFLKPCTRYTEVGTGYQVCNSYIAINNGGLFGVGIGNSTQKYLYLPEAYTDFIFPVIVEELGLIVGAAIIIMYAYIIFRIIKIAKRSYDLVGGLICYGVAMYLFTHLFINLMGVLGLFPLTGVPLPFLSYGGSYAICLTIALTLVQRVSVETNIRNQEEKLQKKIKSS